MGKKSPKSDKMLKAIMQVILSNRELAQAKRRRDEARPNVGTGIDGYPLMSSDVDKK